MAKKLSDKLRPASFRGVPFFVEDSGIGVGRRVQVHEYPKRDKAYVEDLGRATREIEVQAFVVGESYIEQANKLIEAAEKEGAGQLVHPWLGTMNVALKELMRVSFSKALGQAIVTLSFVEAGELAYPSAQVSTQAATRISAGNLQAASIQSFADKFSVKGFQDFVRDSAQGRLGDVLGVVSSSDVGKVLGMANGLARDAQTVMGYVSNPSAIGDKLMSMFGLSGVAGSVASWTSIVRSLARVSRSSSLSSSSSSYTTPSRQQVQTNTNAVNALTRQALLVQAVGASSLVGTDADVASAGMVPGATDMPAGQTTVSYQDMIAARDDLLAAIDAESLTADDAVYVALQEARAAVAKDIGTRARDNARLDVLRPNEVTPALVLAYDYYEDAAREAELVARNRIRHPGFVPVEPLKVLTR